MLFGVAVFLGTAITFVMAMSSSVILIALAQYVTVLLSVASSSSSTWY
jgi:hypothetical protein